MNFICSFVNRHPFATVLLIWGLLDTACAYKGNKENKETETN